MTLTDVRTPASDATTQQRVTPQPGRPPARAAAERATLDGQRLPVELFATLALLSFSIAVGAGFARVFSGWQFLDDFIVLGVVGHGLSFVTRRLRLAGIIAIPLVTIALIWLIAFLHYRDSMTMFIPTGETLDLYQQEIDRVREEFATAVAPVIYAGGWEVLAAIGMVLVIVLSDTFAFRAFARAESLVPGGVLFVFVAALGDGRDRVALSAALVACGVVTTIALRAFHAPSAGTPIGARRSQVERLVPIAVATALVIAALAAIVGPRLPGADAEPIYETRGGRAGTVTNVVSPLVDIRSRLTNRSNAELFTVRADFESYWRVSALPRFDGTTWGLPERTLSDADGVLSDARLGSVPLTQEITINALGDQFVPAAPDPLSASPQEGLRWNGDAATLLKTDGELVQGEVFEITSASPRFEPAQLQAATSTDPGDSIYLDLPDGFPSSVTELAREVTAGTSTSYEAALTLQAWFRSEFTYSIEVQAGHSTTAIEGFLRDRVGYCEQFAGTYAAMLRSLGIPARVSVGFTAGNFTGERYSVLGKNAHAWPEVWFDELGWVPFEPTPGRGIPGAESYTNVAAEQDATGVDPDADSTPAAPDVSIAPAPTIPGPDSGNDGAVPDGVDQTVVADSGIPDSATESNESSRNWLLWILVLAVIAGAIAIPELVRRWRRAHPPSDPNAAMSSLWDRSVGDLRAAGINLRPSSTPVEQAAEAAEGFPVIASPVYGLATAVTAATYAPPEPDASAIDDRPPAATLPTRGARPEGSVEECRMWSRQIQRAVNDSMGTWAKVKYYFTRWH